MPSLTPTDIQILKMLFLVFGLIAMSTSIYQLTIRILDFIVKIHKDEGSVSFRPFGYCTMTIFMSAYLLHIL